MLNSLKCVMCVCSLHIFLKIKTVIKLLGRQNDLVYQIFEVLVSGQSHRDISGWMVHAEGSKSTP